MLDSHSEGVYDAAITMYKSTCAYCKWEDQGIVTISGMTERDSMASSPKLEEVRELGLASSPKDKKNAWQSVLVENACYPYQEEC